MSESPKPPNTPGSSSDSTVTLTPAVLRDLFKNLIWPAVAGNVAWAFFTVLITEPWSKGMFARLLTLVLMAQYLFYAWLIAVPTQAGRRYYALDGLFALGVVTFAIATQDRVQALSGWVDLVLLGIFAVAACGHGFGIWDPNSPGPKRRLYASINAIGILIMLIAMGYRFAFSDESPAIQTALLWARPLAIWFVIALWRGVRSYLAAHKSWFPLPNPPPTQSDRRDEIAQDRARDVPGRGGRELSGKARKNDNAC